MRLWIDDLRPAPAPDGYVWCKSVNEAKDIIARAETRVAEIMEVATNRLNALDLRAYQSILKMMDEYRIELIDVDHDLGDYAVDGGDGVKLLDWLEETGRNYPIRIHSANAVGVANMRRIIERNGWKEIR